MFTSTSAYERFMGRWSRRLAPSFAAFAEVRDGDRVLDVGCGTGALSSAILAQHPTVSITGLDPSPEFIEGCKTAFPAAPFVVGDAARLPFADEEFDVSLACLVLSFVSSPKAAVAEMSRVTVRGGTVAATIWDHAQGMTMLRAFWEAAEEVDKSEKPAEAQRNLEQSALASLWNEAGFKDIRVEPLTVEMPFASFDDYWSPFLAGQGPAGAYVAAAPAEIRASMSKILRHRFLGDGADRPFTIHSRAWAIRGTVAG